MGQKQRQTPGTGTDIQDAYLSRTQMVIDEPREPFCDVGRFRSGNEDWSA